MFKYPLEFIDHYRLLKPLKEGEFVGVYLAEDQNNQMQVAVKVLDKQANLMKDDADEIFLHAGRIMSRLDHPNIVRLYNLGDQGYGIGEQEGCLYLVTSYAVNGSVRQHHPRGFCVPLETIIAYIKQTANALDYAHAQHILHGHLKPENILLGTSNKVLLSDFGFTDSLSFPPVSHGELPLSSVLYLAPEQLQGKPHMASDQYALAVMAYEWLSGRPPFTGSVQDILFQHAETAPPPLRSMLPHLSSLLEEVIMTALTKNPAQRFATIVGFANAFEQAVSRG